MATLTLPDGSEINVADNLSEEEKQEIIDNAAIYVKNFTPDVSDNEGLLSNAPDGLGIYLGTTCKRMGPEDAIYAGFADTFIPQDNWHNLKIVVSETGNWKRIIDYGAKISESFLKINATKIRTYFMKNSIFEICSA